jgi:hypothetical protein
MMCRALAVLAFAAVLLTATAPLHAQAAWEYAPYRVRIWLALEQVPQLPPEFVAVWSEQLKARAASVLGAVWEVEAEAVPPALQADMFWRLEDLTAERVAAVAKEGVRSDKLYLVNIVTDAAGYRVAVRELDGRTRQMGPAALRTAPALADVPGAVWDAVYESFTPLARIERVDDKLIAARLRAGGLIVDSESPALIEPGMVLSPYLRRNDRSGEPVKNGVAPLPWTLLAVESRTDSLLSCRMYSGYRSAIPTRGGARLERLAMLIRPRYATTRLVLESRAADGRPLVGYDLYSKLPADTEAEPELIGSSDSFGSLELLRGDGTIRLFYIKSGRQLLGRLPIVPGQAPELVVKLPDDDSRLQAEGFISALQSRALDLVARREILAARFRRQLKDQKYADAQTLLDDFRKLETQVDLRRSLDEAQQDMRATDKLTQTRIDKLFAEARKLLNLKALSDEMLNELNRELIAARSGQTAGGGAAKTTN